MQPVKIGILGLGTVGCGTVTVLARNHEEIARRAGREMRIVQASARDLKKKRPCATGDIQLVEDARTVVRNPEIEVIVELIGGIDPARALVLEAIEHGKHVVTANKALIAMHGNEIFAAAQKQGVMVAFEAAVAGGIPIIKMLREGLTANRIEWLAGIINGTSNFILTEMRVKGVDFADVLKEAQRLGYAEVDPVSTSRASMPRTSSRFSPPSPSVSRCSSTRCTSKASRKSRAWTCNTPNNSATD